MFHCNLSNIEIQLNQQQNANIKSNNFIELIKESLLKQWMTISSSELLFNQFSHDLDEYFNTNPPKMKFYNIEQLLKELTTTQLTELYSHQKNSITDTNAVWQWLSKLTYCLEVHLKNASFYHQFQNKLDLCKEGVVFVQETLKSIMINGSHLSFKDVLSRYRDYLLIMINLTELAGELFQDYLNVKSLKSRIKDDEEPREAKFIVDCCIDSVILNKNDTVMVIDKDLTNQMWSVEAYYEETTKILSIPSIFLVLEGYDRQIVNDCTKLKNSIRALWKSFNKSFRNDLISAMNVYERPLNDNHILMEYKDPLLFKLKDTFEIEDKLIPSIIEFIHYNPDDDDDQEKLVNEAIQYYNDSKLYSVYYENMSNGLNYREECLVAVNKPRYVTMAYISSIPEDVATEMELSPPTSTGRTAVTKPDEETIYETDLVSDICITPMPDYYENSSVNDADQSDIEDTNIPSSKSPSTAMKLPHFNNNDSAIINNNSGGDTNTCSDTLNINYSSSFRFYLHETITRESDGNVQKTVTIVKPNNFVALPCYINDDKETYKDNVIDNLQIKDYQNGVIICEPINQNPEEYSLVLLGVEDKDSQIKNIESCIKSNMIDIKNAFFKNPETNEIGTLKHAVENNLIISTELKNVLLTDEVLDMSLKSIEKSKELLKNAKIHSVFDRETKCDLNELDAAKEGIYQPTMGLYYDQINAKWIGMEEAIKEGWIVLCGNEEKEENIQKIHVNSVILPGEQKLKLDEAIEKGIVNQLEDQYCVDQSPLSMRLIDAVKFGYIDVEPKKLNDTENLMILRRHDNDVEFEKLFTMDKKENRVSVKELIESNVDEETIVEFINIPLNEINSGEQNLASNPNEESINEPNNNQINEINNKIPLQEALNTGALQDNTKLISLVSELDNDNILICDDYWPVVELKMNYNKLLSKLNDLQQDVETEESYNDSKIIDKYQNKATQLEKSFEILDEKVKELSKNYPISPEDKDHFTREFNKVIGILDNIKANLADLSEKTIKSQDQDSIFYEVEICEDVIKCKNQDTADLFTTIIYGLVSPENSDNILDISMAIEQNLIDVEEQTVNVLPLSTSTNNIPSAIHWKEAIELDQLLAFEYENDLITPDLLSSILDSFLNNTLNLTNLKLINYFNGKNKEILTISEAIDQKLFDEPLKIAKDTIDNKWLSLKEAVNQGVLYTRHVDSKDAVDVRVVVICVRIGNDEYINLSDAIISGVLSIPENKYISSEPKLEMSLLEAVLCGLIEVKLLNLETNEDDMQKLNDSIMVLPIENDMDFETNDLNKKSPNSDHINMNILSAIQVSDCFHTGLLKDEENLVHCAVPRSLWDGKVQLDPLLINEETILNHLNEENNNKLLHQLKDQFAKSKKPELKSICKGKQLIGLNLSKDDNWEYLVVDCESLSIQSIHHINPSDSTKSYMTDLYVDNWNILDDMSTQDVDVKMKAIQLSPEQNSISLETGVLCGLINLNDDGWKIDEIKFTKCISEGRVNKIMVDQLDNWLKNHNIDKNSDDSIIYGILEENDEFEAIGCYTGIGTKSEPSLSKYLPCYKSQLFTNLQAIQNIIPENIIVKFNSTIMEPITFQNCLSRNIILPTSLVKLDPLQENTLLYEDSNDYALLSTELFQLEEVIDNALDNELNLAQEDIDKLADECDQIKDKIALFNISDDGQFKEEKMGVLKTKEKILNDKMNKINEKLNEATEKNDVLLKELIKLNDECQCLCLFNPVNNDQNVNADQLVLLGYKETTDDDDEIIRKNLENLKLTESNKILLPNGKGIDLEEALLKSIIIGVQLPKDMINPDFLLCLIDSKIDKFIDPETMNILGVIDTDSQSFLPIETAENLELINKDWCTIFDNKAKEYLCYSDAIDQGILVCNTDKNSKSIVNVDYLLPKGTTESKIDLIQGIQDGYVDLQNNRYQNMEYNLNMRLVDAIMIGVIHLNEEKSGNLMPLSYNISTDPSLSDLHQIPRSDVINLTALSALSEPTIPSCVSNNIYQAIYSSKLTLDPVTLSGNDILKSCIESSIQLDEAKPLIMELSKHFLGNKIGNIEDILPQSELCNLPLDTVDTLDYLVIDCENMSVLSVWRAQKMIEKPSKLFLTGIEFIELMKMLKQVRLLFDQNVDLFSYRITLSNNDNLSLISAIMMDKFDLNTMSLEITPLDIIDDETNYERIGLNKAVEIDFIDIELSEQLKSATNNMRFENLISDKLYHLDTNKFGEDSNLSLQEAINQNLIDPDLVYLPYGNDNSDVCSLSNLIGCEIINPLDNTICVSLADTEESIHEPLNIYLHNINNQRTQIAPLESIISLESTTPDDPLIIYEIEELPQFNNGIPLTNAIQDGYVTMQSLVKPIYNNENIIDCDISVPPMEILYCDDSTVVVFIEKLNQLEDKLININNIDDSLKRLSTVNLLASELENIEFDINEFLIDEDEIKCPQKHLDIIQSKLKKIKSLLIKSELQKSQTNLQPIIIDNKTIIDNLNKHKLKLNSFNRDINKIENMIASRDQSKITASELSENIQKILEYERELTEETAPSLLSIRESLQINLRRSSSMQIDQLNSSNSVSAEGAVERYFVEVRNFKDDIEQIITTVKAKLISMFGGNQHIEKSLAGFEQKLNQLKEQVENDVTVVPMKTKELDDMINKICKYRREAKAQLITMDKYEKTLPSDFHTKTIFKQASDKMKKLRSTTVELIEAILVKQKLFEDTKSQLANLKDQSKKLKHTLEIIGKMLESIKEEQKCDEYLIKMRDLRQRLGSCVEKFDPIKLTCDKYLADKQYVKKDGLKKMINELLDDQTNLYNNLNEELAAQIEFAINGINEDISKIQVFIADFPNHWNTKVDELQSKVIEIKKYEETLQNVNDELTKMDKIVAEDLNDTLDIDLKPIENVSETIQFCEHETKIASDRLSKLLNTVVQEYLPVLSSYQSNKIILKSDLDQLDRDMENLKEEIGDGSAGITPTSGDTELLSVSSDSDTLHDKKVDIEKMKDAVNEIEPILEATVTYGREMIDLLFKLSEDCEGSTLSTVSQLQSEINDLMAKFELLDSKVNSIKDAITNLPSHQQTEIMDKLTDEIESWHALRNRFNKLEPVLSQPEKLNKQKQILEEIKIKLNDQNNKYQTLKNEALELLANSESNEATNTTLEPDEIKGIIKEIDTEVEIAFERAKDRQRLLDELEAAGNQFWPRMMDLTKSVHQIHKEADAITAFPGSIESSNFESPLENRQFSNVDLSIAESEVEPESAELTNEQLEFTMLDPKVVQCQQHKLDELSSKMDKCVETLDNNLDYFANSICEVGGTPCLEEIGLELDNLHEEMDFTHDVLDEKKGSVEAALSLVNEVIAEGKKLNNWFTDMEKRVDSVNEAPPDQKLIQLQMMEFKMLSGNVLQRSMDVDKLNKCVSELLQYPNVPQRILLEKIKDMVNEKYNRILDTVQKQQNELQNKYVELGDLDEALEENNGILQELENQLKHMTADKCKGDAEYTKSCIHHLKLLSNAFNNMQPNIDTLTNNIEPFKSVNENPDINGNDIEVADQLRTRGGLSIFGKLKELLDLNDDVENMIKDKLEMMEGIWKYEKSLGKEVLKHLEYLDNAKVFLKQTPILGITAESANDAYNTYMLCLSNLSERKLEIQSSIDKIGQLMLESDPSKCQNFISALRALNNRYNRCKLLSEMRKERLTSQVAKITEFDKYKQSLFGIILELEQVSLRKLAPSKITATCANQITVVTDDQRKAEELIDKLLRLNIDAAQLRNYSSCVDNTQLSVEVKEYKLKLAKIQKCLRERLRMFKQAYKEDKLFSDSYDDLNRWLDISYDMIESFKGEQDKVQEHLDKLKTLCKQLSAQYANFHCTVRYGSYLKDRCTVDDPEKAILLDMLKTLKIKWNNIRSLITSEKTIINKKMIETGSLNDAVKCVHYWINELTDKFDKDMKTNGDVDTVEILMNECQLAQKEADNHNKDFDKLKERLLREIEDYKEEDIRKNIDDVEIQLKDYIDSLVQRALTLEESLQLANLFKSKLDDLQYWLTKSEHGAGKSRNILKFHNETDLINAIEKHETFLNSRQEMKQKIIDFNKTGKQILSGCHPMAKNYIHRIMTSINKRWNQIGHQSETKTKKLAESLSVFRGSTALIEDLIQRVGAYTHELQEQSNLELPNDIDKVEEHITNHNNFHGNLEDIDLKVKNLLIEFKVRQSITPALNKPIERKSIISQTWRNSRDSLHKPTEEVSTNSRVNLLNSLFNHLWKLSVDRKSKLNSHLKELQEIEMLKKFDFQKWRSDFLAHVKAKGIRLTDIFRKQTVTRNGYLTEDEFIACMLKSGFHTTKGVLQEVFKIFDRSQDNMISYQEFIDSLRPDRRQPKKVEKDTKPANLTDKKAITKFIHDTIEREVAQCCCAQRFFVKKEGENKYRFGNNSKMYMVRYLNSVVMVRIGGGWQTLGDFLKSHDPCRTTNIPTNNNASNSLSEQSKLSASTISKSLGSTTKSSTSGVVKTGSISAVTKTRNNTFESSRASVQSTSSPRRTISHNPEADLHCHAAHKKSLVSTNTQSKIPTSFSASSRTATKPQRK